MSLMQIVYMKILENWIFFIVSLEEKDHKISVIFIKQTILQSIGDAKSINVSSLMQKQRYM